jgi:hypothetical protein
MGLGVVGDFVGESGSVGDFVGETGSVGALVGDVGEGVGSEGAGEVGALVGDVGEGVGSEGAGEVGALVGGAGPEQGKQKSPPSQSKSSSQLLARVEQAFVPVLPQYWLAVATEGVGASVGGAGAGLEHGKQNPEPQSKSSAQLLARSEQASVFVSPQ